MEKIQIASAISPVRKLETGKGTVGRATLWIENGRIGGYLKLLDLDGIVKESLCWALARYLGLPIPQAYYVFVNQEVLPPKLKLGNPFCLAFGSEEINFPLDRIQNRRLVEDMLIKWKFSLECGVFDEWIINRDRIPNNLLYSSNEEFLLIDHDEALPAYASSNSHSVSGILETLGARITHAERQALYKRSEFFIKRISKIDWEKIIAMVVVENVSEIRQDLFLKHVELLKRRSQILSTVVSTGLGISQVELLSGNEIDEKKEKHS